MRQTVIFVLIIAFIIQCSGKNDKVFKGNIKSIIGLYCPDKNNYDWQVALVKYLLSPVDFSRGTATKHFQFIEMNFDGTFNYRENTKLSYMIQHTCTGSFENMEFQMNFPLLTDKTIYGFIAGNLKSEGNIEEAYEKVFTRYLKKECPTGDCSSVRERVDCSIHEETEIVNQCKKGLESAYNMLMVMSTTTQKSNTTTFIIIGAAVGVVLLIAGFVACFFCRRKKKNGPNASGMTSGTTAKTNSMTKSGTTKQTTATGTFQKTGQTGTNVTGMQRY